MLLVVLAFVVVIGGGGLLWYLSETAEFSRKLPAQATAGIPPKAIPVMPKTPPPVAIPVMPKTPPPVAIPVREPAKR